MILPNSLLHPVKIQSISHQQNAQSLPIFIHRRQHLHNNLLSVLPTLTAVKHPARSEEEEAYSDQFANNLFPLNCPSLPGASMMTALSIPNLTAHHVA